MPKVIVLQPASWSKIAKRTLFIKGDGSYNLTPVSQKKLAQLCQDFFRQKYPPKEATAIEIMYNGIALTRNGRVISRGYQNYTLEIFADFSGTNAVHFKIVGRYANSKPSAKMPFYMQNVFSVFFIATLRQEEEQIHEVRCTQENPISR